MRSDLLSTVICVGELLWDALPEGLFLGGAPFNVAGHLARLGVPSAIVTRVGDDLLGEEAMRRAALAVVDTSLVQVDQGLPTGLVRVTLDGQGGAAYEILAPAAWDAISPDEVALERCAAARALVFGTLAQRDARSRSTIRRLCELPLLRVLDVNLRPPHDERAVVEASLHLADVVKCNEAELERIAAWFEAPPGVEAASRALAERFGCDTLCVTRGEGGAALLHQGSWHEHRGFPVTTADPVGAGDAFLAGFLEAMLEGVPPGEMLKQANLLGAFVASRHGALPAPDAAALAAIEAGEPTSPASPITPPGRAAPTGR